MLKEKMSVKGDCPFCEGEATIEAYRDAEDMEIEGVLAMIKMCVEHAKELANAQN